MSLDAMKQVAEAEAQSRQTLQDASLQAKQILSEAEARGKASYEAVMAQTGQEISVITEQAAAQAEKNADEILHHAENQCAVVEAHALSRMDQAAQRIVERIVIR